MKDNIYLNSIIHDFNNYNRSSLEATHKDLELCMPVNTLEKIRIQYAMQERRYPSIGELLFLDHLSTWTMLNPSDVIINELLTDDENIMRTFSDLNGKRNQLSTQTTPITLAELSLVANKYLESEQIKSPYSEIKTSFEKSQNNPVDLFTQGIYEHESIECKDDSFHMAVCKNYPRNFIEINSTLMLVSPNSEYDLSVFENESSKFIRSMYANEFHFIYHIDEKGLIYPLLKSSGGFQLDLVTISAVLGVPAMLSSSFAGKNCFLIATHYFSNTNLDILRATYNLRFSVIGNTSMSPAASFRTENNYLINFEAVFLRSMLQLFYRTANISKNSNYSENTVTKNNFCKNIINISKRQWNVYISECKTNCDFYLNSIKTICKTVLPANTNCKSPKEIKTDIELLLPLSWQNEAEFNNIISILLGLYRAQTELVIPLGKIQLKVAETDNIEIKIASIYERETDKANFELEGGMKIFYLDASKDNNGIPNFDNLRDLMRYVSHMSQNADFHAIYSPCKPIKEILTNICNSDYAVDYTYQSEDIITSEFSFVVVSNNEVEGKVIGRVIKAL